MPHRGLLGVLAMIPDTLSAITIWSRACIILSFLLTFHLAHGQPEQGFSSCGCSSGGTDPLKRNPVSFYPERHCSSRARPECAPILAKWANRHSSHVSALRRRWRMFHVFARDFQVLSFTCRTLTKRAGARRRVEQSSSDCRLLPCVLCYGRCPVRTAIPNCTRDEEGPFTGLAVPNARPPGGSLAAEPATRHIATSQRYADIRVSAI